MPDLPTPPHRLSRLLLACSLFLWLTGCKDELPADQRWQATVTEQIVAGYTELSRLAEKQDSQVESFCAAPTDTGLGKMQNRWRQTMDAWQRLQWVQFGPAQAARDRLQYWPEQTADHLRQTLHHLLDGHHAITADSLTRADPALQGLSAQELLVFGSTQADTKIDPEMFKGRPCDLLRANARLTARHSQQLAAQWQEKDWLLDWFVPPPQEGKTAGQLRNAQLLDALTAHVDSIVRIKLNQAESWRSQHSLANIQQNLLSLQQLTSPDKGYGLFLFLKDRQQKDRAEALVIKLDNVHLALQQIKPPLAGALQQEDQQSAIEACRQSLRELADFLRTEVAPALTAPTNSPAQPAPSMLLD